MIWDSIVIGIVCVLTILLVEKALPGQNRWRRALVAGVAVAVFVAVWLAMR